MTPAVSSSSAAVSAGTTGGGTGGTTGALGNPTVTENMFLQLLVAQIRNQDPLNPADSAQYLTQLAQFQQVEQGLNTNNELAAIRQDLDQLLSQTQSTTGTQS
jgi:flagellar basal-body rod modification protein FlgD